MKLPRETDDERRVAQAAFADGRSRRAEVPLAVVEACVELVEVAEALAGEATSTPRAT